MGVGSLQIRARQFLKLFGVPFLLLMKCCHEVCTDRPSPSLLEIPKLKAYFAQCWLRKCFLYSATCTIRRRNCLDECLRRSIYSHSDHPCWTWKWNVNVQNMKPFCTFIPQWFSLIKRIWRDISTDTSEPFCNTCHRRRSPETAQEEALMKEA